MIAAPSRLAEQDQRTLSMNMVEAVETAPGMLAPLPGMPASRLSKGRNRLRDLRFSWRCEINRASL